MILTADNIRDAKIDIVDDRWQHVEPSAIGAAHDGIGQGGCVEMAFTAHAVVPQDRRFGIEPEAPVRRDAGGGKARMIGVGERKGGAIIVDADFKVEDDKK